MTVNTHPHAKYTHVRVQWRSEVRSYRQSGWGRERFPVVFTISMCGFYKNTKAISFFNLENTTKLLIDTFKSFGKPWFSSQQQHSRRHQEGNPPERWPPSPFPPKSRKALGREEGRLLDHAEIPTLSFLTWSAILEGSLLTTLLKKEFTYREEQGGTFSVTSEEGVSPTCGLHTIASPSSGSPAQVSQIHLQGGIRHHSDKNLPGDPLMSGTPWQPTQAFSRAILCSGTESSLPL